MSGPPPYTPQGLPQQGQEQQPPPGPVQQHQIEVERAEQTLTEILGGQLPGAAYLFPDDPTKRQQNLVKTDPDAVRDSLLRGIEVAAQNSLLPYGSEKKAELGRMALEFAQAYLLLDPSVDAEGVPIEEKARINAQYGHEETAANAHATAESKHIETVANQKVEGTNFTKPPRVKLNPAAEAVKAKNKPKSEILKSARGDNPRPSPRVGS